jgi:type I restriction enzyme M protein
MVDRRHKELTPDDIRKIADTYHAWRGEPVDGQSVEYKDVLGFCKVARLGEIGKQGCILTPGRYVGAEEAVEDDEAFEEKMKKLTAELAEQMEEGRKLDEEITIDLKKIHWRA